MKKHRLLVFIVLLALFIVPVAALASDISGADFFGVVIVSNNSTATANLTTTMALDTDSLIAGNYMNASANNSVIRSSSGAEVRYMPGWASNPWCIWVTSIGGNTLQSNILYTAESSGGEMRYFPGLSGMTSADDATLELGANFTVEDRGWVDTTAIGANLTAKVDAFTTTIGANNSITSTIFINSAIDNEILRPSAPGTDTAINNQFPAAGAHWEKVDEAASDEDATYVFQDEFDPFVYRRDLYNLPAHSSGNGTIIDINVFIRDKLHGGAAGGTYISIRTNGTTYDALPNAQPGAAYVTVNSTWQNNPFTLAPWTWAEIDALEIGQSITCSNAVGGEHRVTWTYVDITYLPASQLSVSANGVTTDEHIILVASDGVDFKLYVDSVELDSTPLTGAVFANNNDWVFFDNYGMPYVDYHKITINDVLRQDIQWDYAATFSDKSGNGNDATPSFRTTSASTNVTAYLTSFGPMSEAEAPAFSLATAPDFIATANMTSGFTTVPPPGGFPLAGVITAVANATSTPPQLPLLIIAVVVILALSLSYSAATRRYGSGNLVGKMFVIIAIMGVFVAIGNFGIDFWMLAIFLSIAVAVAMASQHRGWA